jgi:hypothetical protein
MSGLTRIFTRRTLAAVAALITLGVAAVCVAGNPNPGVLPPHANAQGNGYSGWSAAWWQWYLSIPTPLHPALDTTGEFCAEGQSGKVFFLAANLATTDTIPCTVRTGTSIFLGVANAECSTVEAPPFFGSTEQEMRDCARCWANHIVPSSLAVTVDGQALADPARYRAASPLFTFEYPADNIIGIPGGPATGQSVSDGYWIYLHPLPAGEHAVSFSGVFDLPAGDDCGSDLGPTSFAFGGSYKLNVQGGQ